MGCARGGRDREVDRDRVRDCEVADDRAGFPEAEVSGSAPGLVSGSSSEAGRRELLEREAGIVSRAAWRLARGARDSDEDEAVSMALGRYWRVRWRFDEERGGGAIPWKFLSRIALLAHLTARRRRAGRLRRERLMAPETLEERAAGFSESVRVSNARSISGSRSERDLEASASERAELLEEVLAGREVGDSRLISRCSEALSARVRVLAEDLPPKRAAMAARMLAGWPLSERARAAGMHPAICAREERRLAARLRARLAREADWSSGSGSGSGSGWGSDWDWEEDREFGAGLWDSDSEGGD